MTTIVVGQEPVMSTLFVGQVAVEVGRRLGRKVTPREITAAFYDRLIPEELGPVVGGRRLIRVDAVEVIAAALKKRDDERRLREETE